MRKLSFFTLFVLAMAVVLLLLSGWGRGANGWKSVGGTRQSARRPEYEGGRVLSETREAYPARKVTVREEVVPSQPQAEERTLPSAVRVAGYVFLLAVAFAASAVLGGAILVVMEYLLGWPNSWWL